MFKSTNSIQYFQLLFALIALSIAIYFLNSVDFSFSILHIQNYFIILPFLALSILNLWLEYKKWNLILEFHDLFWSTKKILSNLSKGVLSQFFVPIFFGNLIGRLTDIPKEKRKSIATSILWSNFSQYLPTLFFATIAIYFVSNIGLINFVLNTTFLLLGLLITSVSFLFYFYEIKVPNWTVLRVYLENPITIKIKLKLLFFSSCRYIVFVFQYFLVLNIFESTGLGIVLHISFMYLIITVIPGFVLGKIGIREAVSVVVLGSVIENTTVILASSMLIWFLNNVVAFSPSLFLKSVKA